MEDLSVPFRKVLSGLKPVASNAAAAAAATMTTSTMSFDFNWKLLIAGAVLLVIFGYFFLTPSKQANDGSHTDAKEALLRALPQSTGTLAAADKAFERFNTSHNEADYSAAIENYQQALSSGEAAELEGQVLFNVATLFHEGVPDKVSPDAQSAIHYYREAIKRGFHGAVLRLASIYHWGLAGYAGNREVAKHLYGAVLKTGSSYEKGVAKDRLKQMREESGQSVGSGMLEEEAGVSGNFTSNAFGSSPYAETFMDIDASPYALGKDEATRDIDEKYVDDLIQNKLGIKEGQRQDEAKPSKQAFSDPENARDHVIVNSAKQSLERLRANTHIQYDVTTTFKMVHEYIVKTSSVSQAKRDAAALVLREMAKGIANVGYEQSKEIEALHLVWNRIHSQVYANEPDKRKCLMENLVNELSECIEYGQPVCPTGRMNRIIDALNQVDALVNVQSKWMVQQFMVARAGQIQKSLLAKSSAETREAMASANPSARQRQLQDEFIQKTRAAIERDLTRTYVDTGLVSKELLKTELEAWIL
jgi:tetratricopeptide (TPR) repeat protein